VEEREERKGPMRLRRAHRECRGFFLHDFPPSVYNDVCPPLHCRRPRGGGGLEAANAKRAPRAILPPAPRNPSLPTPVGDQPAGVECRDHAYASESPLPRRRHDLSPSQRRRWWWVAEKRSWKWRPKERKERRRRPR